MYVTAYGPGHLYETSGAITPAELDEIGCAADALATPVRLLPTGAFFIADESAPALPERAGVHCATHLQHIAVAVDEAFAVATRGEAIVLEEHAGTGPIELRAPADATTTSSVAIRILSMPPGLRPEDAVMALSDHGFARRQPPERLRVGWHDRPDELVDLCAGAPGGFLSPMVARMLAVVDAPITIHAGARIALRGLSPAIAEQVVRVLAPQGLIFDANSPHLLEE